VSLLAEDHAPIRESGQQFLVAYRIR